MDLYHAYQTAQNPALLLQQLSAQNPAFAQLRQMQAGGQDMKGTFYALCQQQGVDPASILSQFQ